MQLPFVPSRRWIRALIFSLLFHAVILASVLLVENLLRKQAIRTDHFERIAELDIAGGSHRIKIPLSPMPFASHTRAPNRNSGATKNTIVPVPMPQPKHSRGGTPPSPHKGDGSGKAFLGNGSDNQNISPTFPIFSSRPPLTDRSLLPPTERKIVVDVDVDAQGAVVNERLVRGIGNQLDQMILDIVKTWRFQPATVDGKPVPAEAELIFPFNQDYPITASDRKL